ncbi:MAG: cell division protein FtsA [Pseudomonadota bacterium]
MEELALARRKARRGDRRLVAGVDLGASKVACFIAEAGEDGSPFDVDIVGVGCCGVKLKPGAAISIEEMENGLRRAVDAAERMAGARIDRALVAAPGRFLRARRIGVDLEIADGVVTQEDVDDAVNEGRSLAAAPDCAPLFAAPVAYRIDGESEFDDPVGQSGSLLSAELVGVSARESVIDNLAGVLDRCGLRVSEFIPAPLAASECVLLEDEKELGVVLIDIGAASTDFAVFEGGALIDCGGVALGGVNITKDIAKIFGAPLADAERIKTLHGAALIGPGDEHRFIDFPQLGEGAENARASRADLSEVIISRLEEIFELVGERILKRGGERLMLRRAVITGGGAHLLGAREVAERSLEMKARIGRPTALTGAPDAATAPGYSVCAGLVSIGAQAEAGPKFSLGAQSQSLQWLTKPAVLGGARAWLRAKF